MKYENEMKEKEEHRDTADTTLSFKAARGSRRRLREGVERAKRKPERAKGSQRGEIVRELCDCFLLGTNYADSAERIKKNPYILRNPCLKEYYNASTCKILGRAGG